MIMMMTMMIMPTHSFSGNENACIKCSHVIHAFWVQFYPWFNLVIFFILLCNIKLHEG